MFDQIPFRSTRWIVAHGHGEVQCIGHLDLQLLLPHAGTGTIATTAIGFDQQARGLRKALPEFTPTPVGNIVDRKGGGIRRLPHVDGPPIVAHVVNAIGDRTPNGILRKIVRIDHLRLLTPDLPRVLEVADL